MTYMSWKSLRKGVRGGCEAVEPEVESKALVWGHVFSLSVFSRASFVHSRDLINPYLVMEGG